MTAYFPFWQKLAAVMRRVCPSTSFHSATFLSGMFQSRSFPSREPLRKYRSSWGEEEGGGGGCETALLRIQLNKRAASHRSTHPGVERDGRDEVDVLEAAETFPPGDVPQPDRLIHGGGEQEEVLDRHRERTRGRGGTGRCGPRCPGPPEHSWPTEGERSAVRRAASSGKSDTEECGFFYNGRLSVSCQANGAVEPRHKQTSYAKNTDSERALTSEGGLARLGVAVVPSPDRGSSDSREAKKTSLAAKPDERKDTSTNTTLRALKRVCGFGEGMEHPVHRGEVVPTGLHDRRRQHPPPRAWGTKRDRDNSTNEKAGVTVH
ncbi:hypothetical protein EYF80_048763 [Liparis tanakae]|uniref:Uncharacterized protein n=1 Tax=Liparis tanakae TaxID=230148 RepID=A0A4Z2FJD1_9TELE|nr:hypothetical protein EYF80_048763 [Liparis tanakae]